jgi:nanoRNase/pAp phosphatase (c-di-AMP/oligoRNAs hydrolase)
MRYVLVSADGFFSELLAAAAPPGHALVHVVETPAARAAITRRGGEAVSGNLEDAALYRRAFASGHEPVLVAVPAGRRTRVIAAIRRAAPEAPVLVMSTDGEAPGLPTLSLGTVGERVIGPALERTALRARAERIQAHFADADRVLILMQDDPDPDAIASALALRCLLGRNKTAAPIATFGTITRPENRAMTRILEIDLERIAPEAVREHAMVAMVDTQPSFFEEPLGEVDLVIDHHPEDTPARAKIKDIRPAYGATATILTEYLRATDVKVTQRLATALLYGIKADTLALERGATRADMEAFAFLHALANHSALRRIERPELPGEALDVLAGGIARRQKVGDVVFSHLGAVAYPELVAQFADFFMQVENVEWSVVSGTVSGELHVSVRNVGYVRGAGDVVSQAFADLGSAGGHRSMAKAVIRLRDWRARVGDTGAEALRQGIVTRFLRALRS